MSIATAISNAQQRVADCYTAISGKGGTLPATQNLTNMPTAIATIPAGTSAKFGATVNSFIGDVNGSGELQPPSEYNDITFTGVITIPMNGLEYRFYRAATKNISFPDLITLSNNYALRSAFYGSQSNVSRTVSFPLLSSVSGNDVCRNAFMVATVSSASFPELIALGGTNCFRSMFEQTNISSFSLPKLANISGLNACENMFAGCTSLTEASFPSLTYITGGDACRNMFNDCTSLATVSFTNLSDITGASACYDMFAGCTSLTTVSFPSLNNIPAYECLSLCFRGCTSLTTVSFPSLRDDSFGSNTDQFEGMLMGCSNVTVHFPSNLQDVIGFWSDVTNGFSGTNTTVLFDLPSTAISS